MPYTPQTWANGSVGGTPISATRLNRMEAGIAAAADATTTAGGAVARVNEGPLSFLDPRVGAVADNSTDCLAAFNAAMDLLPTLGGSLYIPPGQYYSSDKWLVPSGKTVRISGTAFATFENAAPTRIRFAAGKTGIHIPYGGGFTDGSVVEYLCLKSSSTAAGPDIGVLVTANSTTLRGMLVDGFGSHGFSWDSSAPTHNCNHSKGDKLRARSNRGNGFNIISGVNGTNACEFYGLDAVYNTGWGVYSGGIKNVFVMTHCEGNTGGAAHVFSGGSNTWLGFYSESVPSLDFRLSVSFEFIVVNNYGAPDFVFDNTGIRDNTLIVTTAGVSQLRVGPSGGTAHTLINDNGFALGDTGVFLKQHKVFRGANPGFGEIPPGGSAEATWTCTGVTRESAVVAYPAADLGAGILVGQATCTADNTVKVQVLNVSGAPLTPVGAAWRITAFGYPSFPYGDSSSAVSVATRTNGTLTENVRSANYTLALADAATVVAMNVASANTLTVPPNSSVAFPTGTVIEVHQLGAGQTTITAGAGVTLRSSGSKLKLAAQYASASLRKRGTDEWVVSGDLVA